jgi:chromosome segregation ATPase
MQITSLTEQVATMEVQLKQTAVSLLEAKEAASTKIRFCHKQLDESKKTAAADKDQMEQLAAQLAASKDALVQTTSANQTGDAEKTTQITSLTEQVATMEVQLKQAGAEATELTMQLSSAKSDADQAVLDHHHALELANGRAQIVSDEKQAAEAAASITVQSLRAERKSDSEALEKSGNKEAALAKQLASLQESLLGSQKEVQTTKDNLSKARDEADQLKATLATKRSDSKTGTSKTRGEVDELRKKLVKQATDSKKLLSATRLEADEAKKLLTAQKSKTIAATSKLDELRKQIVTLTAKVTKKEKAGISKKETQDNLASQLSASTAAEATLRQRVEELDVEIAGSKAEATSLRARVDTLESAGAGGQAGGDAEDGTNNEDIAAAIATVESLKATLKKERARSAERIIEMSELFEEMAELKHKHSILEQTSATAVGAAVTANAAHAALAGDPNQGSVQEMVARISYLQEDVLSKSEMLAHAERSLKAAQLDIDEAVDLQSELFELQGQIVSVQETLNIEQNENSGLHNELIRIGMSVCFSLPIQAHS